MGTNLDTGKRREGEVEVSEFEIRTADKPRSRQVIKDGELFCECDGSSVANRICEATQARDDKFQAPRRTHEETEAIIKCCRAGFEEIQKQYQP